MTPPPGAKLDFRLTVNGEQKTVRAHPMDRLLDVLRENLGLTGAKEGCGEGECGACAVLMDGALVDSCLIPVLQARDSNIVTIENLSGDPQLSTLQRVFLERGGAQCGICTPGMILAAKSLLDRKPRPTLEEIREGLSGNLCRCTGYTQIFEAVAEAATEKERLGRCPGMRSDPADYELVAPANLKAAVSLLAEGPGRWLPIAGGTDLMVQYAAGTLRARRLFSIWNLPDLRRVEVFSDEIRIGAGSTYTDLREHPVVQSDFPLLARAASWVGGIANQNRGTLGGNIVNASPAADSLPALLAYGADLILVSTRGERRISYRDFHLGYKKTSLAPDELILAVCLPRHFANYIACARKVGTRNAQAISKVCIAALAKLEGGMVRDARIAVGSVAPMPLRLSETERVLEGNALDPATVTLAKKTAAAEIRPIDDIRSTARYRAAVVSNLVAEFLEKLGSPVAEHE